MYTRADLVADVLTEANNIKQHATAEEIENLDFENLHANHRNRCVYGQMTGDCNSERAAILIEKCTPRYFKYDVMPAFGGTVISMARAAGNVNGTKCDNFFKQRTSEAYIHFSAIEAYILLNDAQSENLINFIKGNTQIAEL